MFRNKMQYRLVNARIKRELSALVVVYVGIIKLALVLQSLKGHCYDNQLSMGAFLQMSKLTAFTLRSGILKRNALSLCECTH